MQTAALLLVGAFALLYLGNRALAFYRFATGNSKTGKCLGGCACDTGEKKGAQ